MNAKAIAERRVARQKQHRAKTGGLTPRQHRPIVLFDEASVACPKCGATGADLCRTPSGRIAEKPHKDRSAT